MRNENVCVCPRIFTQLYYIDDDCQSRIISFDAIESTFLSTCARLIRSRLYRF